MRSGLLGGAFDPPHRGHVVLAARRCRHFGLDRSLVLVVAEPAHKPVETPVDDRLELARAAFARLPTAEVRRDDHAVHGRLLCVPARFDPDGPVFLVGADEFAGFLTWKEPDACSSSCASAWPRVPAILASASSPCLAALQRPERVELFEIPAVDVSSTRPPRAHAAAASRSTTSSRRRSRGSSSSAASTMKVVDPFRRAELR